MRDDLLRALGARARASDAETGATARALAVEVGSLEGLVTETAESLRESNERVTAWVDGPAKTGCGGLGRNETRVASAFAGFATTVTLT